MLRAHGGGVPHICSVACVSEYSFHPASVLMRTSLLRIRDRNNLCSLVLIRVVNMLFIIMCVLRLVLVVVCACA